MMEKIEEYNELLQSYTSRNPRLSFIPAKGFNMCPRMRRSRSPATFLHHDGRLCRNALAKYGHNVKHAIITTAPLVWQMQPIPMEL